MPVVTVSGELAAPPDKVFALVADWSRHPLWQPSLSEAELEGELAVGAHVREVRAAFSQKVKAVFEVVELEPGRRLVAKSISGPMKAVESYLVEPVGDGSRLTITFELEPPLVLKMFQAYFEPQLRVELEKMLENVRHLLDDQEPPHPNWVWQPA